VPTQDMKLSVLLLVFLTVLAATRPSLVNCRVLSPQKNTEKAPHEPLKVIRFLINLVMAEKANTSEGNMSNRVLAENKFQTMSSGPSRRGSGH